MSAYEELVARCEEIITAGYEVGAFDELGPDAATRAILAEVLRTLETVTPEMAENAAATKTNQLLATATWLAMLHVSPLAQPK